MRIIWECEPRAFSLLSHFFFELFALLRYSARNDTVTDTLNRSWLSLPSITNLLIRIVLVFPGLDWSCYTEDTKANVTVLDLKDVYEKGQMRRNASSEQRLLNAEVHLKATAQKPIQVNDKIFRKGTPA